MPIRYILEVSTAAHPKFREALETLLGPDYVMDWLDETPYVVTAFVEGREGPIFNINTHDDIAADEMVPEDDDEPEDLDGLPTLPLSSMEEHPSMKDVPWVRGLTEQERQALSDPLKANE